MYNHSPVAAVAVAVVLFIFCREERALAICPLQYNIGGIYHNQIFR